MSEELFQIVEIDAALLHRERVRVLAMVREIVPFADVLEVGSTAVEGLVGKGDIDILVRAPIGRFEHARDALDAKLKRNEQQLSNASFQGYRVESPLDVCVQMTIAHSEYDDFEAFCSLLRASSALRDEYNALKRSWDGRSMSAYREAKQAFVLRALESSATSPLSRESK